MVYIIELKILSLMYNLQDKRVGKKAEKKVFYVCTHVWGALYCTSIYFSSLISCVKEMSKPSTSPNAPKIKQSELTRDMDGVPIKFLKVSLD